MGLPRCTYLWTAIDYVLGFDFDYTNAKNFENRMLWITPRVDQRNRRVGEKNQDQRWGQAAKYADLMISSKQLAG